jgi:cellulose synthase/poly-beta-1,6-N-acetylglucosamine synthase-like glycosyltransferase
VELIVARADTTEGLAELAETFPAARFVSAPPGTDFQSLRGLGFARAGGDVVTLLDHGDRQGIPPERWLHELQRRCALHRSRQTSEAAADSGAPLPHPYLSVVVPVHQGARVLPESLAALVRSELPRALWELIVVDDASTDGTALVAARFADVVVRLPGRAHGAAYARNRGFEFARGECVAFVNADVCVHSDTLTRFTLVLAREPEVTAVFGSFDPIPNSGGLVSQYRNLLLHYHHQENCASTETFCASCGAVRSAAFASVGMFDEWRSSPHQLEDFELGRRLRQHGYRIVMRPDIRSNDRGGAPRPRCTVGTRVR